MRYRTPTGLHASTYMDSMESETTAGRKKTPAKELEKPKTVIAKTGKKKK